MARTKPTMKKMPAVRLAVRELGIDAAVAQIRKLVKEKYNIDMTDATAQNYVSSAKREIREAKATPSAAKSSPAAPAASQPRAMPKAMTNGVEIAQVVEAVTVLKGLVGTLGKDNVMKLVDAL
jgi:hypothetical protein